MTQYTPQDFGAKADGLHDDSAAINAAIEAAILRQGSVELPPGRYLWTQPGDFLIRRNQLAIVGRSPNVSRLIVPGNNGPRFVLEQDNIHQPFGLHLEGLSFCALGAMGSGTALRVTAGRPVASNEHYDSPLRIRNVSVRSSSGGWWSNGIEVEGVWNPLLQDVFISGNSCGMDWNAMRGAAVNLRGMCVNAHLDNVRANFWAEGIKVHAESHNTEGIFCSNCSMVAVKRGVWLRGNPAAGAGRISTFTWHGGLIENRVGGVKGGSAAFHLEHVWTALIQGSQMITETMETLEETYGVIPQDCHGVVVTGCDINAYKKGVFTTGACRSINVHGNTFTNCPTQVEFTPGTTNSRSAGNTRTNNAPVEFDHTGANAIELAA